MGKDDKPQVQVADVRLGEVWDKKAAADAPKWAEKALADGLGRDVEVVSSRPKSGFIAKPTIDIEYDEDEGELTVRLAVVVTSERNSMVAAIRTKGGLKKVDPDKVEKKLKAVIDAVGRDAGKDAATEIAKAAKDR